MRYRLMATYRGVAYEAGIGPTDSDIVLFAACPPPEELGFLPAPGHWRKPVTRAEVDALWESRPWGSFRDQPCLIVDDLGEQLHIGWPGADPDQAARLGYHQVEPGVFEALVHRDEVTGITEERIDRRYPGSPAPAPPAAPGLAEGQPVDNDGTRPLVPPPAPDVAWPAPLPRCGAPAPSGLASGDAGYPPGVGSPVDTGGGAADALGASETANVAGAFDASDAAGVTGESGEDGPAPSLPLPRRAPVSPEGRPSVSGVETGATDLFAPAAGESPAGPPGRLPRRARPQPAAASAPTWPEADPPLFPDPPPSPDTGSPAPASAAAVPPPAGPSPDVPPPAQLASPSGAPWPGDDVPSGAGTGFETPLVPGVDPVAETNPPPGTPAAAGLRVPWDEPGAQPPASPLATRTHTPGDRPRLDLTAPPLRDATGIGVPPADASGRPAAGGRPGQPAGDDVPPPAAPPPAVQSPDASFHLDLIAPPPDEAGHTATAAGEPQLSRPGGQPSQPPWDAAPLPWALSTDGTPATNERVTGPRPRATSPLDLAGPARQAPPAPPPGSPSRRAAPPASGAGQPSQPPWDAAPPPWDAPGDGGAAGGEPAPDAAGRGAPGPVQAGGPQPGHGIEPPGTASYPSRPPWDAAPPPWDADAAAPGEQDRHAPGSDARLPQDLAARVPRGAAGHSAPETGRAPEGGGRSPGQPEPVSRPPWDAAPPPWGDAPRPADQPAGAPAPAGRAEVVWTPADANVPADTRGEATGFPAAGGGHLDNTGQPDATGQPGRAAPGGSTGGLLRPAARPPWEILGGGLPPKRIPDQTAWAQLSNPAETADQAPEASTPITPEAPPSWDDPPGREAAEPSAWAGPGTQAAPDVRPADLQHNPAEPTVLAEPAVLAEPTGFAEPAVSTEPTGFAGSAEAPGLAVAAEPVSPWDDPPASETERPPGWASLPLGTRLTPEAAPGSPWDGTPDPADQDAGAPPDTAPPDTVVGESQRTRHRGARPPRAQTRQTFAELVALAALPTDAYAVDNVVDGAICLIGTSEGFEVFSAADGARHEVRFFADEEAAYFYLFGLLAAEAVRDRRLVPTPFLP